MPEKRIFAVGVIVRGASGLVDVDAWGLSDPYCVVKAILATGTYLFVHRTRVIKDSLNPAWNESFLFDVPAWAQVVGLRFQVWDSDEGEFLDADGEDDYLGGLDVDLTTLRTGASLRREAAELIGAPVRKKKRGKKRTSTLDLEVSAYRRVEAARETTDTIPRNLRGLPTRTRPLFLRRSWFPPPNGGGSGPPV